MPYQQTEYKVAEGSFHEMEFSVSGFKNRWTAYQRNVGSYMTDMLYADTEYDIKLACINYSLGRIDGAIMVEKDIDDQIALRLARQLVMEQLEALNRKLLQGA